MRWKLEDSPERALFRAEVVEWLARVLPSGWMTALENGDDKAFAEARRGWNFLEWMGTIGRTGYAAPLWPKEYGGLSGEAWTQQIVREELARHRLPTFGVNLLGVGLAGPTIISHGTNEQKARYLARILTGEEIWCQLFSEPGAGSDLASVSTRAIRDGDEWVVNGQKVWTSLAQYSTFGMLLARTDPDVAKHDGLTYFIVEMASPGIEIRPLRQITGSADFNEVFFTDVRLPDANRVGDVGDGWRCARTTLMSERVALSGLSIDSASMTGGVRRDAWEQLLSYVRDRADPSTRQGLARVFVAQEVKEITAFRANSARAAGQTPGAEGGVSKVFNAEFNQFRANLAVDAGGMSSIAWASPPAGQSANDSATDSAPDGATTDSAPDSATHSASDGATTDSAPDGAANDSAPDGVANDTAPDGAATDSARRATAFLRTRANTIEGGTSEILRDQIAERILGLPREVQVDRDVAWSETRRG